MSDVLNIMKLILMPTDEAMRISGLTEEQIDALIAAYRDGQPLPEFSESEISEILKRREAAR